jgi:transcriptional regulator with XRE-family HTH domain
MEKARKELGKKIREIRKIKGLTQEELGEKANLNYKFVGELERGKVNVSLDSLVRISKALEIYIGDLFRKVEEPILKIAVKGKRKKPFYEIFFSRPSAYQESPSAFE